MARTGAFPKWALAAGSLAVRIGANVDDATALDILRARRPTPGITFFDTADVYGGGRSETLIGRFLKESGLTKVKIFVATKLGRGPGTAIPISATRKPPSAPRRKRR